METPSCLYTAAKGGGGGTARVRPSTPSSHCTPSPLVTTAHSASAAAATSDLPRVGRHPSQVTKAFKQIAELHPNITELDMNETVASKVTVAEHVMWPLES